MDMRGLAHFIQDIRKATRSPAEEKKRVDFELAKIRLKFRKTATMSTYNRKKYVCKLMFIAMLGYPVGFGHMEGVKLLAVTSPAEKLIGYLSLTVFLYEDHPLLTLATHMIHKDLLSGKECNISLALTAIANTGGKDFSEVMCSEVKSILLSDQWDVHIRKKAVLTYLRIYRKYHDVVDLAEVVPVVTDLVLSPLLGLSGCAVVFLTGCFSEANFHLFQSIPHRVIELLEKIIVAKQTEPEYVYYGVPAPWLQAMCIRLLRKFPVPDDLSLREKMLFVLWKIVQATSRVLRDAQAQQNQKGTTNRVSAINAVFFEVFLLVIEWDIDNRLRTECLDILTSFVTEKKDSNLRYLGFSLLSRLCSTRSSDYDSGPYLKEHQPQIVVALHDPDVSIRANALDVTLNMCDAESAREVIGELLSYLPIADEPFKKELVLAIARLAEAYCSDYGWYVETIVSMIAQAGSLTPHDIVCRVVDVIINYSYVQKRAAEILFNLLKSHKTVSEVLLRVAAVVLGEFGYQIALSAESTPFLQVVVLHNHLNDASEETQSLMLSTFVKMYNYYDVAVREKIMEILLVYRSSFNVELEQRAREYVGLIELGNDELLQEVLGPLPAFREDALSTSIHRGSCKVANVTQTLTELQNKEDEKNAFESTERPSGSLSPAFLMTDPDTGLKLECKKEVDVDALFHITSPLQLERMANENELVRQWFVSLLFKPSGILYSDEAVELHCEQQYCEAYAQVRITVRTKEATSSRNVLIEIVGVDSGLLLQSRNERGDVSTGKDLLVDFVARSWAPYLEAPTIRLTHRGTAEPTTVMKVLSLPIMTTKFLSPYDEKAEMAYDTLCKQMDSVSSETRHLVAGSFCHKETLINTVTGMGFRIFHTSTAKEWKGIAAHATQAHGTLLYTPVVVNITIYDEGALTIKVIATSSILRTVIVDALERLALSAE